MGLGFVLLIWAVVGTLLACIGAVTFGGATALFTRRATRGRRYVIIAASLFPFVCLAWGAGIFVFQAVVNEGLLQRDLGLGDTWHAPLPNDYQVMMIDDTDRGWVYNPRTQFSSFGVVEQEDAVAGVTNLQVVNQYVLGATNAESWSHSGKDSSQVSAYFLLDTATGKRTQFQNYEELRGRALELSIDPNLQPINTVYSKYRFSWFDVFAGSLFLIPPLIGGLLLIGWIVRVRRTRPIANEKNAVASPVP